MKVLLTGGSGRLGRELRALLPEIIAPTHAEMDITIPESVEKAFERYRPQLVVHAAAYTDVAKAEQDQATCWRTNVEGTQNMVRLAWKYGAFLIHISTDYVFDGTRGMHKEDDPVGPVRNYYALTKLAAEAAVRVLPVGKYLIIRTSFRPRKWPYPVAFTDVYTSQDYVDVIAPEIALAIQRYRDIPYHTLHIATERKSVYDLARRRKPDVRPGTKASVGVALPDDISLDISRWKALKEQWRL